MSSKAADKERRKKARKSPPSLVYVELGAGNGGMMRDLSEEGFALRVMMPVREGEKTSFSFLLNPSVRIEGQGEILWIKDNGRIAGVRFVEMPSTVLTQIQSWLNGTLESREDVGKLVSRDAQSFDELREELRSSPPRAEPAMQNPPVEPTPPPETVAASPPWIRESEPPKETPAGVKTHTFGEHWKTAEVKRPGEPAPFSEMPIFPVAPEAIEITFEPLPPAEESVHESFFSRKSGQRIPLPAIYGEKATQQRTEDGRPAISEILMQPPRKGGDSHWRTPGLDAGQSLDQNRSRTEGSWTEWFTLSRAVGIMVVLALVAGISAYHRTFGETLIWLGEQMGGAPVSRVPTPGPEDGATDGGASQPSSNPPETSPAAASSSTEAGNQGSPNPLAAQHDNPQTSPPLVARGSLPPVTPLSGISSAASTEPGQEMGLTEYSQAMRLLHEKNGEADISEAVRLLWISVEKGNLSAELTLAELYWHGQGVARNCDQTRILLSAAARKGSPDAQKRLRQFEQEGCE